MRLGVSSALHPFEYAKTMIQVTISDLDHVFIDLLILF